jgi:hypothetical protein
MSNEKKQVRPPFTTEQVWEILQSTAENLKGSNTLKPFQTDRFNAIVKMESAQKSRQMRKQARFLTTVRKISPYYYLLCALALSQNRLWATSDSELAKIVAKIRRNCDNATFIYPNVRYIATKLNIEGAQEPDQEKQQESKELHALPHAELMRTTEVFGDIIANKILHMVEDNTWKAAVSMAFTPYARFEDENWVPCMTTLDIREEAKRELAMALFEADVIWIAGVFKVIYKCGRASIATEITLKGVSNEVIVDLFGPEIAAAINDCPVRVKELSEGKGMTECVTMMFSRECTQISLAMGLESSIMIQHKLYR